MGYSKKALEELARGYMSDYEKYRDAVLSGSRLASRDEFLKVKRQEDDLKNGVDGYKFDWNLAVRPLI